MKKQTLLTPISLFIIGALLVSGESFGKTKHYIVKLKGNVLYAHNSTKKAKTKNVAEQEIVVVKDNVVQPAQPIVKPAEVAPVAKPVPANTASNVSSFNYEDRQVNIHTSIFQLYPGTYLDSMSIVNHLLSDSIRDALAKVTSKENCDKLKGGLENCMKDSVTLDRLGKLSTADNQIALNQSGILIAHCKDATSAIAMDSVIMDVFSGSSLVASGMSDKNGIILAKGITEGDYYVVFSRKAYQPFSLMRVKITTEGQSYIDIPLAKQNGYVFQTLGNNAWMFITTGSVLVLFFMVVLAFYLAKYTAKRSLRTTLKNSAII